MPRFAFASASFAMFCLLPSCSLLIDTNPDGVIPKKNSGGQAGADSAGSANKAGAPNGGDMSSGGTGNGTTGGSSPSGGNSSSSSGGVSTGGLGVGGTTGQGGSSATSAGGGTSSSGGAVGGGNAQGAGSSGLATAGAGTGGASDCTGGAIACGSFCVDTKTSKANCGSCGYACESYQFCAQGKCLPTYQGTKVLPLEKLVSTGSAEVISAMVQTNKAQDDLVLQLLLTDSAVRLSAPGALVTSEVRTGAQSGVSGFSAVALARFTASGTLMWGRDLANLLGTSEMPVGAGSITRPAFPNGDVAVAYVQSDPPPTGPTMPTSKIRLARISGADGVVRWTSVLDAYVEQIVYRSAKSEFVGIGASPSIFHGVTGNVVSVVDSGTSADSTLLGKNYATSILAGPDGTTLWLWGANYAGTYPLNPWSSTTYTIGVNPTQISGTDAYIVGVRDDGSTIGPWMSEGDWGPQYRVALDARGDLLVAAGSAGIVAFHGSQDFLAAAGQVLVKIRQTDGKIMWRTAIDRLPDAIVAAPAGRLVTMTQQRDPNTLAPLANAAYQIKIYSGEDGSLLSTVGAGAMAQVVTAGTTELFLLGYVSSAADFDPGAATETHGGSPGIYISRFGF